MVRLLQIERTRVSTALGRASEELEELEKSPHGEVTADFMVIGPIANWEEGCAHSRSSEQRVGCFNSSLQRYLGAQDDPQEP